MKGVLSDAWEMYKTHWRHLVSVSFAVYVLIALFSLLLVLLLGWFGVFTGALISLAGVFWLQGALVTAVEDVRDGRADLSISETLARLRPRMNTLAVAGILAAVAITIGFLLLILPGLFLLTIWSVIVPVIMLERAGILESFGRSRELTRGYRWNVLGVIVLTVLVLIGVAVVLQLIFSPFEEWLEEFLADIIGNTLTAPFVALAWTLMYYRLRDAREPEPAEAAVAA